MVVISATLNVVLGLRLVSVERSLGQSATLTPVSRVKIGTHLEDIVGTDPDGLPTTVRFAASTNATVLLVARPGCVWCDKNMANWQTLVRRKSQTFNFVTISLSPAQFNEYVRANNLPLPAVFPSFAKNPTLSGITGTPQTIVVGPDAIVKRVWFGAYTLDIKREVEAYFGVALPTEVQVTN